MGRMDGGFKKSFTSFPAGGGANFWPPGVPLLSKPIRLLFPRFVGARGVLGSGLRPDAAFALSAAAPQVPRREDRARGRSYPRAIENA